MNILSNRENRSFRRRLVAMLLLVSLPCAGAVAAPEQGVKPVEGAKPAASAKPAEGAKPVVPAKPAEGVKPVEGAKPADAAKPAKPAEKGRPTVYEVQNVSVSVPLTAAKGGGEALHEAGVVQGAKEAMQRLFRRMLSGADRESRKELLATLLKDAKRLTERIVVRAEKQHADHLSMTVDVFFSKKGVGEALGREGISYNEAPYPTALLLLREEPGAGDEPGASGLLQKALLNAARDFGITLLVPMGDLEDLTRLSWERAVQGDAELLAWATSRYGAGQTWALQGELASVPVKSGPARFRASGTLVSSRSGVAPLTCAVKEEKPAATREEGAALVANRMVQQVMDRWIQDHVVQPGLKHQTRLKVVHEAQLARMTEFMAGLRGIPGVKEPGVLNSTARETVLGFDYQGRDEVLKEALGKLGARLETTPEGLTLWLVPSSAAPAPPAAAPASPASPAPPAAPSPAKPATPMTPKTWM